LGLDDCGPGHSSAIPEISKQETWVLQIDILTSDFHVVATIKSERRPT